MTISNLRSGIEVIVAPRGVTELELATAIAPVADDVADEVDRATGVEAGLNTRLTSAEGGLAAEITRATTAEGITSSALTAEISRATDAEDDEVDRATGVEAGLNTRLTSAEGGLAAEITRATTAEGVTSSALTAEISRATDAEDDEVDRATGVEAGLNTRLTSAEGGLAAEITRATTAEGVTSSALTAEINRAVGAEDDEVDRATGVEAGLNTRLTSAEGGLAAEITRATTAEGAETNRATAAEEAIGTTVSTEAARATNAEADLGTRITATEAAIPAEVTRATGAEEALANRVETIEEGGASSLSGPVRMRPGEPAAEKLFISVLTGGDPGSVAAFTPARVVNDEGSAVEVTGEAIVAARSLVAVEPDETYVVRGAFIRKQNSVDPSNDTVLLAIAWYNKNKVFLGSTNVAVWLEPNVADGRQAATSTVRRGGGAAVTPVANAVYGRPYIRTFGAPDTKTHIEVADLDRLPNFFSSSTFITLVGAGSFAGRAAFNAYPVGSVYAVTDESPWEFYIRIGAAGSWDGPETLVGPTGPAGDMVRVELQFADESDMQDAATLYEENIGAELYVGEDDPANGIYRKVGPSGGGSFVFVRPVPFEELRTRIVGLEGTAVTRGAGIIGTGNTLGTGPIVITADIADDPAIAAGTTSKLIDAAKLLYWLTSWLSRIEEVDTAQLIGNWAFRIRNAAGATLIGLDRATGKWALTRTNEHVVDPDFPKIRNPVFALVNKLGKRLFLVDSSGRTHLLRPHEDVIDPDFPPVGNPVLRYRNRQGVTIFALWSNGTFFGTPDAATLALINAGSIQAPAVSASLLGGNIEPGRVHDDDHWSYLADPTGHYRQYLARRAGTVAVLLENVSRLRFIWLYGQSNRTGQNVGSALTTTPPAPNNFLSLNYAGYPKSPLNTDYAGTPDNFVPMRETFVLSVVGEGAGASSAGEWYRDNYLELEAFGREIFVPLNTAIGGRTLPELMDGGGFFGWDNHIEMLDQGVAIAATYGIQCIEDLMFWDHGESNTASYDADLWTMVQDWDAVAVAATGQAADQTKLIATMVSADENSVNAPATWTGLNAAVAAHPTRIYISGQRYTYALVDNTHLDAAGNARRDKRHMRCVRRIDRGETVTDFHVVTASATRVGAVYTLPFLKPLGTGDAAAFTDEIEAATDSGFFATDGGVTDTISSIVYDNTPYSTFDGKIIVTVDGAPAGAGRLRYATGRGTTMLNHSGAWGNAAVPNDDGIGDYLRIFDVTP